MGVSYHAEATLADLEFYAAVSGIGLPIGAYRAWGGADLPEPSASDLDQEPWRTFFQVRYPKVTAGRGGYLDDQQRTIFWGEGPGTVRRGDVVTGRGVAAILWSDAGRRGSPSGRFDARDLVVVADGAPPRLVTLSEAVPEPFRVLRFRDFTFLQTHLRTLKLFKGKRTGVLDRATQEALRGFQADHGLEPDGLPDADTLAELLRAIRHELRN
jgi:hypothetical protein